MAIQDREKKILLAGAACLLVFVLFVWSRSGGRGREDNLQKLEKQRAELVNKARNYQAMKRDLDAIDARIKASPEGFDLIEHVNKIGTELGITFQNLSKNESGGSDYFDETSVTLQIKEIPVGDLVIFLTRVEDASAYLRVTSLAVRRKSFKNEEPSPLEVNLRISAYSPKKTEGTP